MHLLFFFFFVGCAQNKPHDSANEHMHRVSHAELIKRFDDPKRDEQQRPEVVMKLLSPLANLEVIDIGIGSGYFAKHLLDGGAFVTGADVDDKFLKFVTEKFSAQDYPRFKILKIDFNDPKMKADFYDMAFTSNT
jgi:2-polyprenyl-3-methyl-5-hydroxy-6-metoxy-1,4-benzoquinol methylase